MKEIFYLDEMMEIDDAAQLVQTKDGYLVAMPRVARTGIQKYAGAEMDMPDRDMVNVYRPETEVFNLDSWKSFAHRPVTLDHPPQMVDAGNWKKYAVGQCGGDVARDGDFIRIPMTIMDGEAIKAIKDGKAQLSVGYSSKILFEQGTAPDGQVYDAVQTNIRVNHVAVVDRARGGPKLKFGDTQRRPTMTKVLDVGSIRLELEDKDVSIIQAHIESLNAKIADAVAATTAAKTASDTQVATLTADASKLADALKVKDAEIAALKKQVEDSVLSPQKIADAVREMTEVCGKARAILGDKLVTEGKFAHDVKRQVVDAKLGEKAKDWDANMVDVAFISFTADAKPVAPGNSVNDLARDFTFSASKPVTNDSEAAYREMCQRLQDGYKNQPAKAS